MKILRKLIEQVELADRREELFRKNDAMVLGVSGGSDSMALLGLFLVLRKKHSWRLTVAHLDHGFLAGSHKARELVRKFCEKHSLPFYSKKIRLGVSAARRGASLEDAGRQERYLFFETVAKKVGAARIVTAHTLDDQAETVLMSLLRGSGFRGLAGIPYKRVQGSRELIRPLLSCSKKDLLAFVRESRLPSVRDPSNRDVRFFRNRIRYELLPILRRRYNGRIDRHLASLQELCREAQRTMDRHTAKVYKRCVVRRSSDGILLNLQVLKKIPAASQGEVLLKTFSELKGDSAGFAYAHVRSVLDIVRSARREAQAHLPHGLRASKKGALLRVGAIGRTSHNRSPLHGLTRNTKAVII